MGLPCFGKEKLSAADPRVPGPCCRASVASVSGLTRCARYFGLQVKEPTVDLTNPPLQIGNPQKGIPLNGCGLSSTESRGCILGEMQSLINLEDAGGDKNASQWSRKYSFARAALIQLERVGSNKKSISEHGAGHCILKTLLQAHILKMQCVPALAAILHTWYAYRTLVTWFRNSGRSGAVPVHLIRFASPQLQGLSKMTNVLRGSGQKTLLESFLDVRSHDAFKLGPQPWRHRGRDTLKLDESIAAGERILGPRSELQFDAFMRKVFDTVWCNKRVSTVSAIRAMIITTASRCEERSAWWASGLSSFADLAGLLEQYVAEKEKFRADAVAATSGASRGQPPPKKPRFGTVGDVVSTSFSFSSGVAAVVESWAFVEHLSSFESSVSWEELYVLFQEYGCKYSGSAFVTSHTLENLILMNHMHRRLPINLIDADKYFLVGLGPNTADF